MNYDWIKPGVWIRYQSPLQKLKLAKVSAVVTETPDEWGYAWLEDGKRIVFNPALVAVYKASSPRWV